jgi:hypothetical protein
MHNLDCTSKYARTLERRVQFVIDGAHAMRMK